MGGLCVRVACAQGEDGEKAHDQRTNGTLEILTVHTLLLFMGQPFEATLRLQRYATSIRFLLHARELHDGAPFLDFRLDEGAELLGRTRLGHDPHGCELLAQRGALKYADDLTIEVIDDTSRRGT